MGTLKTHRLDLNSADFVQTVITAVKAIAGEKKNRRDLRFSAPSYFAVPSGDVPEKAGWYIILGDGKPIYVGTTSSLHARLNTPHGSLDNFAAASRTSDSERNFIKKFIEIGIVQNPEVILVTEEELFARVPLPVPVPLDKCERESLEKVINIFRSVIV